VTLNTKINIGIPERRFQKNIQMQPFKMADILDFNYKRTMFSEYRCQVIRAHIYVPVLVYSFDNGKACLVRLNPAQSECLFSGLNDIERTL
jgi:hypothetical protein